MSDLISKKALMEAVRTSIYFEQVIDLINSAPAVGGEHVAMLMYKDGMICNYSLLQGIKTADGWKKAYLAPPQPQSVEDAFRLGILYASQKYEVVRNETFTGGDVADFLFMEEKELDDSDIESEIRKLIEDK